MRTVKRVTNHSVASHHPGSPLSPVSPETKLVSLEIHPDGRTSKDVRNLHGGHIVQRMESHIGPLMRRHGARKSQPSAISTSSSGDVEMFDLGLAAAENATVFPVTHVAKIEPTEPGRETDIEFSIQTRNERRRLPANPLVISTIAPVATSPAAPAVAVAPVVTSPATQAVAPLVVPSPSEGTQSGTFGFVSRLLLVALLILLCIIASSVVRRRRNDNQSSRSMREGGTLWEKRRAPENVAGRRKTWSAPALPFAPSGDSSDESAIATPSSSFDTRGPREAIDSVVPASVSSTTWTYKKSRPLVPPSGQRSTDSDASVAFGANSRSNSKRSSLQSTRRPSRAYKESKSEHRPRPETDPETTDVINTISFGRAGNFVDTSKAPTVGGVSDPTSPKNPRRKGKEDAEFEYEV